MLRSSKAPTVGKGGWGKATQRKYLISLRAFFRWVELDSTCREAGMQPFFKSLPRIGKAIRREFIPSQGQMQTFTDGFDKDVVWGIRDYTALCLMLDTGARVGEVCNLEPEDIYWDNSLVNLDGKTGNPAGHDESVIVIEKCVRHTERLKDVLGCELAERFRGYPLYDHAEQKVVRVAVNPLLSGDVVQPFLTNHNFENLFWRIRVQCVVTREIEECKEVSKSAGLVDHLA
jgi:integrase